MRQLRVSPLILLLALSGGLSAAEHEHPAPVVLAPGYEDLTFTPPVSGSYALPPLGTAADGEVLIEDGSAVQLHSLLEDKLIVMCFIYTRCNDVNGCPLATHVFKGVQDALVDETGLQDEVRLLSFSFDPAYDRPDVLRKYGSYFKNPDADWHFLTTQSTDALNPILDAYGQWVIRDKDPDGRDLGTISHLLRVFLIDRDKRIRNIYSMSYLHADTVMNDLKTLLIEENRGSGASTGRVSNRSPNSDLW